MSKRSRQKDRPRIIGTFVERLLLHQLAQEVFIRLPELHHELDVEFEYFAHIPIGFLREPADRLWGFCSLSQEKRGSYATLHREKNPLRGARRVRCRAQPRLARRRLRRTWS